MNTLEENVQKYFGVGDIYQVLQISPDSDVREIKKAYLKLALEIHPDKTTEINKKEEHKTKFQILSDILTILSNPESRDIYDRRYQPTITETTVSETIPLEACSEQDKHYSYSCRCSGSFILERQLLVKTPYPPVCNIFIVDCDSCSNSIKIVT